MPGKWKRTMVATLLGGGKNFKKRKCRLNPSPQKTTRFLEGKILYVKSCDAATVIPVDSIKLFGKISHDWLVLRLKLFEVPAKLSQWFENFCEGDHSL